MVGLSALSLRSCPRHWRLSSWCCLDLENWDLVNISVNVCWSCSVTLRYCLLQLARRRWSPGLCMTVLTTFIRYNYWSWFFISLLVCVFYFSAVSFRQINITGANTYSYLYYTVFHLWKCRSFLYLNPYWEENIINRKPFYAVTGYSPPEAFCFQTCPLEREYIHIY